MAFGAAGTAGQRCTSTRRIIVHDSVADTLVARLKKAYGQVRIGNPLEKDTLMGPLIDTAAVEDMTAALERVKQEGGTIVLISECREGIGSDTFAKWLEEASSLDELLNTDPAKIVVGGHTAVGNAKVLKRFDILVVSSIQKEKLEKRFYKYAVGIDQAIDWVKNKHGENFRSYVMPQGGLIYPCPKGESCSP